MNFTPITSDFSRPFAGNESWNGEVDVQNVPAPLDYYYRFSWCDFEPFNNAKGNRSITLFQQKIQACINAGQKFSFAIMALKDYGQMPGTWAGANSFIPKYVQDGMTGQVIKSGFVYQNFNNAFYLQCWLDLNVWLNGQIVANGWEKYIDYVDVSGYGNSGEWTSQDNIIGTGAEPTIASFKKIIDATVNSYPNIYCMFMAATFDCKTLTGNTNIPIEIGAYALRAKNNKGFCGWKRLSWGENNDANHAWWTQAWTTGNTHVYTDGLGTVDFGDQIRNRYKLAPVCGELMNYVDGTHYSDLDRQITEAHANSIGNGNMEGNAGDGTCQTNAKNAFAKMGAKWKLTSGSFAGNILSLGFSNTGLCPVYENFVIKYYLKQSGVIKYTFFSKDLKLVTADFTDLVDFSTAQPGTYDVVISIEDPSGVRKPYPLANTGANSDGSFTIQTGVSLSGGGSVPPPTGDVTVFTTQVPSSGVDNDFPSFTTIKGINCGVKFIPSINGFIKGIRFYKVAGKTGVHTGELYTSSGTRLAQVTFANETASGWQTALFSTPVAVSANTTYIASFHNSLGNYTETNYFFQSNDLINSVLKIPHDGSGSANGTDPGTGNGLFVYSATPGFPNQLFASQNNWVDVIFNTISVPPNTAPVARITSPTSGVIKVTGAALLDGSTSSDADGTVASYLWSKVSGPAGDWIVSPNSRSTQILNMVGGTYVYKLTVTDNNGLTNSVNYTVTVSF